MCQNITPTDYRVQLFTAEQLGLLFEEINHTCAKHTYVIIYFLYNFFGTMCAFGTIQICFINR